MNNAFAAHSGGPGNVPRPNMSAPGAAGGGGGGGGGINQITPQMLEQLAQAAARGKLQEAHMRAFLELCRTRPEAEAMYRRERDAIVAQQNQSRMRTSPLIL